MTLTLLLLMRYLLDNEWVPHRENNGGRGHKGGELSDYRGKTIDNKGVKIFWIEELELTRALN